MLTPAALRSRAVVGPDPNPHSIYKGKAELILIEAVIHDDGSIAGTLHAPRCDGSYRYRILIPANEWSSIVKSRVDIGWRYRCMRVSLIVTLKEVI